MKSSQQKFNLFAVTYCLIIFILFSTKLFPTNIYLALQSSVGQRCNGAFDKTIFNLNINFLLTLVCYKIRLKVAAQKCVYL